GCRQATRPRGAVRAGRRLLVPAWSCLTSFAKTLRASLVGTCSVSPSPDIDRAFVRIAEPAGRLVSDVVIPATRRHRSPSQGTGEGTFLLLHQSFLFGRGQGCALRMVQRRAAGDRQGHDGVDFSARPLLADA